MGKSCSTDRAPLNEQEIAERLKNLSGWELDKNASTSVLFKNYKVKNFKLGMELANRITEIAEQKFHHPEIRVRWGEVDIFWYTHSTNGLLPVDFDMAKETDIVFEPDC